MDKKKSIRIAYMTGEYPRATDTFIRREVELLRKMGFCIKTISIRRPKKVESIGKGRLKDEHKTYYIISSDFIGLIKSHIKVLIFHPINYIKTLLLAIRTAPPGLKNFIWQIFYFLEAPIVANYIVNNKITHLHNHFADSSCTVSMLASELGGFSFSFSIHGPYVFFESQKWRLDEKVKRASFIRCISHYCRSQLFIWASGKYWGKSTIIHCGVNCNNYKTVVHSGLAKRLIFVGRLDIVKGVNILLGIMPKLTALYPNIELLLVGDGPSRNYLESIVRDTGLERNVIFLGYKPSSEVSELLSASQIFVLPSLAEGLPVVLMEAMSSGLPVVTTRIAGVAELVDDSNGCLVHAGDAVSLFQSITKLIAEPSLRNSMGKHGRDKVIQDFNLHTEVTKLASNFKKFV